MGRADKKSNKKTRFKSLSEGLKRAKTASKGRYGAKFTKGEKIFLLL
jgi:hypothetical protein